MDLAGTDANRIADALDYLFWNAQKARRQYFYRTQQRRKTDLFFTLTVSRTFFDDAARIRFKRVHH